MPSRLHTLAPYPRDSFRPQVPQRSRYHETFRTQQPEHVQSHIRHRHPLLPADVRDTVSIVNRQDWDIKLCRQAWRVIIVLTVVTYRQSTVVVVAATTTTTAIAAAAAADADAAALNQ